MKRYIIDQYNAQSNYKVMFHGNIAQRSSVEQSCIGMHWRGGGNYHNELSSLMSCRKKLLLSLAGLFCRLWNQKPAAGTIHGGGWRGP